MGRSHSMNRRSRAVLAVLLLLLGVSVVVAYGWNSAQTVGQVTGTVYLGDDPLRSDKRYTWTVVFVGPSGSQTSSPVGQDGSFTVENVPVGKVQIAVVGSNVAGMYAAGEKPPPPGAAYLARAKRLEKCKDPAKSELTFMVASGKQQHDIRITE